MSFDDENILIGTWFDRLGFKKLANLATQIHNGQILREFIALIEREAWFRQDDELLEQLYFSGLSYGYKLKLHGGK